MARGRRHDVSALVERNIERARREASQEIGEPGPAPTLPYVAFSRATGIDARPIASAIADRLSFRVLDHELVAEIAREAYVPEDVVRTYDQNPHDQLEQMIADLPFMHLFSEDEYVRHLTRVVRRFAAQGRVVLVGHAASMVLPAGSGVRVFLTAPLEVRTRWTAITDGIDLDEARRRVDAEDERRRIFSERHFGFAPDSLHVTDLVIDVTAHGPEAVADHVVEALAERLALHASPDRLSLKEVLHGRAMRAVVHSNRGPHLL